jgi:hypothetical protein
MRDGTRMNTDSLRENPDKRGFFLFHADLADLADLISI